MKQWLFAIQKASKNLPNGANINNSLGIRREYPYMTFLHRYLVKVERSYCIESYYSDTLVLLLLHCILVGSRRLMPSDTLQPKAYCTNPGL